CVEPTVADVIKHRQFAGELNGVVECGYHRAGDQPDASSARRDGRQQDDWIRTVAAVIVEVVLYCFYRSESHPISSFRQSKCQGVVLRRGHVLQAKRRKEINTETHRSTSAARTRFLAIELL